MTLSLPARLTVLIVGGMLPVAAASAPADELKAAIVLSFLHYAEWSQPLPAGAPLVVGVFGRSSFAEVLRSTLEGKLANGRAVRVIELKSAADLPRVQVVYFATDRGADVKPLLAAPQAAAALTIGEASAFLEWGGAVNLLIVDGRMSFEVNLDALHQRGVNVSSRLLRFGQIHRTAKGDRSS